MITLFRKSIMIITGSWLSVMILAIAGCSSPVPTPSPVKALTVGLTHIAIYKIAKKDTAYELPPPPSFKDNIVVDNIIESNNGAIYYYTFPQNHYYAAMC